MIDLQGYKLALEESIIVSFLDSYNMNELDYMEYEAFKMPYEHFNSNRVVRLLSKAIYNLQAINEAFTSESVEHYISKHTKFSEQEENDFIRLLARVGFNYDTMRKQLNKLIEINEELRLKERLKEI